MKNTKFCLPLILVFTTSACDMSPPQLEETYYNQKDLTAEINCEGYGEEKDFNRLSTVKRAVIHTDGREAQIYYEFNHNGEVNEMVRRLNKGDTCSITIPAPYKPTLGDKIRSARPKYN